MFTERNSPNCLVTLFWIGGIIYIFLGGAAAIKILGSDLRPEPNVTTTINQDIKIDRRTDCKFSLLNRCGGQN